MAASEVTAIVAGGVDFGEADRIVELITTDGTIRVFAHSAKKSKRRFAGALEPFTTIIAQLSESARAKGGLRTLNSAAIETVRLGIRTDLERIALGSFVVELSARTTPEGQFCEPQFELTQAALDTLDCSPATPALRRTFEVRLLAELGYAPELERCVQCGEDPGRTYLDLGRGGLLCGQHRGAAMEVGPKTLQWLRAVLNSLDFEPDGGCDRQWADTAASKLARAINPAWRDILDRPLKSLTLLETLTL